MTTHYIISYDIRHPKRLKRVHKVLLGYGIPLQYSVFYLKTSQSLQIAEVWEELAQIINKKEDDVRLYPVNNVHLDDWNKLGASNVNAGIYID
ncbi:CRISPR-associated endonuclease Cas2 [Thalassotalea ponticola]|uniref:CRISPR-associated endonuclease Cas2 n=1 Tax=Thalassotalea ponticola TaxID=1523392 RepID=UPI0025B30E4F|nr:CRISPR-associated endonuclease Cas2 [Thalassotalea ponticola]MDN3651350.1 CRISPR-associated endonuclease Cas2 [Thalassotalea ponticola]